jgi:hypothetical protein
VTLYDVCDAFVSFYDVCDVFMTFYDVFGLLDFLKANL